MFSLLSIAVFLLALLGCICMCKLCGILIVQLFLAVVVEMINRRGFPSPTARTAFD